MLPEDFFRIFPGLNRAYGQFFITERKGPKLDGYGKTVRESYEAKLWKEHLDGKTGLGVIPIDENNQCKWACLDVDDYSVDIEKIAAEMELFDQKSDIFRDEKIRIEKWKDRLILEGDQAIEELLLESPRMDRKHLRQLTRQARKEVLGNKPINASKKIIAYLIKI